ncbi:hypothetical protein [Nitratiruptor tergarcus]|uniref:Uncharacterized protein n=1 Tax=Nitratiruptor tergarcus DSM 16512 TaxID=1069081 RepID=A0A1W1WT69_9BACT|nr:hypothetical protein [Nitratiruptor tergarcus]SMC09508.1 hypothetical protein SAMN05660197_1321 [Nitratiruptor tergarcus DSM 16512]
MKKEALKELGKLFYDLGKITFAIAVVTPIVKGKFGDIGWEFFVGMLVAFWIGTELINLGAEK